MAKAKAKAKGKAKPAAKKAAKAAPKKAKKAAPKKAAPKKAAKPAAKKAAKAAKPAPKKAAPKKAASAAPKKAAAPKTHAPKTAPAAANEAGPPASVTKAAADAYARAIAAAIPAPTGDVTLGTLRLENYRKPFEGTIDQLSDAEKTQLEAVVGPDTFPTLFGAGDASENEMAWLEYMDVVDAQSGSIVANLLIWPYGDGAVVHHGTTKMIASIVQHGINPHETTGKAWMADFAKAWHEGAPRLGVSSPSHFKFDSEQIAADDD